MPADPLPPMPDYETLRAVIRTWVALNFPGCPFEWATIHVRGLPLDINVIERPGSWPSPPTSPPPPPPRPTISREPNEEEETDDETFVPDAFQEAILASLEGRALRTDALGNAVGDRRRLFKKPKGGLDELKQHGLIKWHSRLGFYRVDAPPPELDD